MSTSSGDSHDSESPGIDLMKFSDDKVHYELCAKIFQENLMTFS